MAAAAGAAEFLSARVPPRGAPFHKAAYPDCSAGRPPARPWRSLPCLRPVREYYFFAALALAFRHVHGGLSKRSLLRLSLNNSTLAAEQLAQGWLVLLRCRLSFLIRRLGARAGRSSNHSSGSSFYCRGCAERFGLSWFRGHGLRVSGTVHSISECLSRLLKKSKALVDAGLKVQPYRGDSGAAKRRYPTHGAMTVRTAAEQAGRRREGRWRRPYRFGRRSGS